jgi:hypothetical protein
MTVCTLLIALQGDINLEGLELFAPDEWKIGLLQVVQCLVHPGSILSRYKSLGHTIPKQVPAIQK